MYIFSQDLYSDYIACTIPINSNNKYEHFLHLTRGIKVLPDVIGFNTGGPYIVSENFLKIFTKFNSTSFELNDVVLIPRYEATQINDNDFNSLKSVLNLAKKMLGRTIFTNRIYNYKLIEFAILDEYDNYFLDYVDFKKSKINIVRVNQTKIIKDLPSSFRIETLADIKWLKNFNIENKESFSLIWFKVVFCNFEQLGLDIYMLPFTSNRIITSSLYISDKFKEELEKNNINGLEFSNEYFGTKFIFT